LADALQQHGWECCFLVDGNAAVSALISRSYPTQDVNLVHDPAGSLNRLQTCGATVLIADSYALRLDYFREVCATGAVVIVLDDLADRHLPVDMVVNGTIRADELGYSRSGLTTYLLGPAYVLLRPEFANTEARSARSNVRRVLVTLGGSDPHDLTSLLASWAADVLPDAEVDAVVGPFAQCDPESGSKNADQSRLRVHRAPPSMLPLMVQADLAISSGGQTTYELAAVGTPSIAIQTAENQVHNLAGLAAAGTLVNVGPAGASDLEMHFKMTLRTLARDSARRSSMSNIGRALVDGHGAQRVARAIDGLYRARRATC